ncbi:4Fe-4S dicluster domain-containing protein [Clostridium botulinum]|uniref:polysaccharide pyruvyl transferase family protein n=1 Tax=Clostridium botulinum TaxID=1491 RepID=UPI0013CA6F06|nr:polysaccharide pyruvyl transferase family protein [Clostridium botulinum]MBN1043576.1 4Fe-4S dicluster domain-containing protein [Clostridium botulinum]NFN18753.1 4Fe-4S dicluster domain-containing protein [Clostridium botulinum]NFN48704.1 4Fe-4S dicluster domain-containing protein [Clostridium botulinum]
MKKIAIMTWYNYLNFGTSLQVTASSYIIKKLGYDTDVIEYIPHGKLVSLKDNRKIKYYIKKINGKINNKNNKGILDEKRRIAFEKFLKEHITLTGECKTDADFFQLNYLYDAFVCGSDQIWAPSLFNSKYFLDFVQDTNKIIAYAPSIGLTEIKDDNVLNRMKESIGRFRYLSIREEQGKKLIKNICDKDALVVVDPTLLLDVEEWDSMAAKNNEEDAYILCYFLGDNKQSWEHVKKLSEKTKLPIKIIPVFNKDLKRKFEVIMGVGPSEFLSLVKNAKFVCTDSFHGTVFSIIYERAFYTYERFSNKDSNSQNSRIYNILKLAGLQDRIVKDKSIINENSLKCEFQEAKRRIELEKEKSINYLRESLYKSTISVNKILSYKITNTCCGCGACDSVCRQDAISIKRNDQGFLTAYIDKDKCIQCGLCKKVCPYNGENSKEINRNEHNLFMVRSKHSEVLNTSSSGGAAYEISKMLCSQGYDIVGCTYDKEKGEAVHEVVLAGEMEKLNIFQGSKYIQSNTSNVFKNVVNTSEKAVIFGTPCQISGIDRLLKSKNKRDKFILVDLICHGVPTQNLWKKYLKEGSIKYGYGLTPEVEFRDKNKGWRDRYINIKGNEKSFVCLDKKDLFYRFFLLGHCYMPACYECKYRTTSAADIRLGDYWGPRYKKVKDGVSMVVAMTNVGEQVLKRLNNEKKIELQKMDCNEYWTVQYPENPIKPVFYNELLKSFKDDSLSLQESANKYCTKFEFYQKIQKPYSMISSIYKKVREIK